MISTIVTLLLPFTLGFSTYIFFKNKNISQIDKLLLTLASSISIFIILSTYGAYFLPGHAQTVLFSLFIIFSISSAIFIKDIPKLARQLFSSNHSKLEKMGLFLVCILILKASILMYVKPIIDADIISTYLPFARTIYIENQIPKSDYYTNNHMTVPPIGGPIIFTTSYAVTKSIQSESFILYTLPFFIGSALVVYKLGRSIKSKLFGLASTAIFLSLPIQEGMLISWGLYPDIIFSFLFTFSIYFIIFKLRKVDKKHFYALLGLIIASMLLLKMQAVIYGFMLILLLLYKTFYKSKLIFPILAILPIILRLYKWSGVSKISFSFSSMTLILFSLLIVFLSLLVTKNLKTIKKSIFPLIITVFFSLLGLLWVGRNLAYYQHPVTSVTSEYRVASKITKEFIVKTNTQLSSFDILSIFFIPAFGTIFLLPKIVGIFEKNKFNILWIFLITYPYILFYLYSGLVQNRYLYPVLTFISLITASGLLVLIKATRTKSISKLFTWFTLILVGLSHLQSKWIIWTSGIILRNYINKDFLIAKWLIPILDKSQNLLSTILSGSNFYILHAFSVGVVVIIIYFLFTKKVLNKSIYFYILSSLLLLPYFVNISILSQGKLKNIPINMEKHLHYFQGELSDIVPVINKTISPKDRIIKFGSNTGLAYKTSTKTTNLFINYGLMEVTEGIFLPIDELLSYLSINNINYAVISTDSKYLSFKQKFSDKSQLFNIIEDERYFKLLVSENDHNIWRLYQRIEDDVK